MLKITKFDHSCVLVETDDRVALFDPGGWSNYSVNELPKIDRIVFTHEHGDHFDIDKLKGLLKLNPDAHIVCNSQIKKLIDDSDIANVVVRSETQCCVPFESPHEELPVPGVQPPAEIGYHFKDVFTHPGDSYSFKESKQVLAMPFVGPWGSLKQGIAAVLELDVKPKYILPIHDWHFSDKGREWNDNMVRKVLESEGITVLSSNSGVVHNLS